ncbi:MAG: hypothetical protein ACREU7_10410 [Burkholderiales bacterium]
MEVAMFSARILFPVFLAPILAGCAGSYQVVKLPEREADLYPLAQTKAGITIAIDEIKSASRARTYFGTDLVRNGIVPVVVVVSNYGEHRVNVKPSDLMLHKGNEVIDPLPLEFVVAAAKRRHGFLRAKTIEQIDAFFNAVAFRETVLLPNETYQGVMFFPSPKPERTRDSFFKAYSLFREAGPRIRVGVTNLDTRDRLHFGPFSAFLGEDAGWLRDVSYW